MSLVANLVLGRGGGSGGTPEEAYGSGFYWVGGPLLGGYYPLTGGSSGGGGDGSTQQQPPAQQVVPPNNGNPARTVMQNCIASYNGSTVGRAIQFFSLFNLATNFKEAWADWTVLPALKLFSLKGIDKASQAIGNGEFLSVTGGASRTVLSPTASAIRAGEKTAGRLVAPTIVLATATDIMAHGTCAMAADPALANAALQSVP